MTESDYLHMQALTQCQIMMEIIVRVQVDSIDCIDQEEYTMVRKTILKWRVALHEQATNALKQSKT